MRWRLCTIILSLLTFAEILGKEQDFGDGELDKNQNNLNGEDLIEVNAEETEILYESPKFDPKNFYFIDNFDDPLESEKKWIRSRAKKDDTSEEIAKYDGVWNFESPQRIVWKNDIGLVLKSKAKHAAISALLSKVFYFNDKPLVVQYEVTMQEGQECGGSYIKLLSAGVTDDLQQFNDKTPYTIMFGPDKCGNDIKLHFIFRHVNPINGSITEKHCRKPKERLEEPFKDKLPHLYQLIVRPDNTFQISVDHNVINEGSLTSDFNPAVNPPREIDDPTDRKPDNWDEREKIPDPDSVKPDDWDEDAPPQIPNPEATKPEGWLDDESEMIADPNAIKPEDWDVEIDGDWEAPLIENPACLEAVGCGQWKAPLIPNPEYKGKWRAALIDNPNYQGKWIPRKIENPDFFEDLSPFKMTPISAVGIELWSMSSDILFDNILITDDVDLANEYAFKTYDLKKKYIDKEAKTLLHRLLRHMNYKPGWWALYLLYVCIPFGCYAYYLAQRAKEETFVNKVINYTNENPWLWGLYIVVLGTPLSFAIYTIFCANKDKVSKPKKDDSIVDDDQESLDDEDAVKHEGFDTPKPKKSDLEVKMADGDTNPEASSSAENSNHVDDGKQNHENHARIDEEEDSKLQPTAVEGTRKRNKARKE